MIEPVFILGIHGRSGTNFLFQLLGLHPDVVTPRHPGEDFLVAGLSHLAAYEEAVARRWEGRWGDPAAKVADLRQGLKEGLCQFLLPTQSLESHHRVVATKTPSTENLHLFPRFFPQGKLLIITRDGRDLVESGVRSGFWPYEVGFQEWKASAKRILAFQQAQPASSFFQVKYEDLLHHLQETLPPLLQYCELDPVRYDFTQAMSLPVFGSSTFRGQSEDLNWTPQAKSETFQPTQRWQAWSPELRDRYHWVCGRLAQELGYGSTGHRSGGQYYGLNLWQDLITATKQRFGPWFRRYVPAPTPKQPSQP
jgi:hypothetical protein